MPDLPNSFWADEKAKLQEILQPIIEEIITTQMEDSAQDFIDMGMDFDPEAFSQEAADYAAEYTDNLLEQLGSTTEAGVGAVIETWLKTPGATVADLRDKLTPILEGNTARADTIGVTEVTRAAVQGDMIAYDQAGAEMPAMFPNPAGVDEPFGPPLHPNCRCMTAFKRYDDQWVIVWVTNNDDLVCPDPSVKNPPSYDVPWGTVDGCRDLDGVCISAGDHEGEQIA